MTKRSPLPDLPDLDLVRVTRRYGRRLEETLGSRTPFLFILGVLSVGLITEGASKLVDAYFLSQPTEPGWLTVFIGVLVLLGGILFYNLPQRVWMVLADNRFLQVMPHTTRAHALIALGSWGEHSSPAEAAILAHRRMEEVGHTAVVGLRTCWLLADSNQDNPKSSARNAQRLKEKYETDSFQILIVNLADVDTPTDTFLATQRILQEIRDRSDLNEVETVADFTGGNKVMTAGLIAACSQTGVKLEYMEAVTKDQEGRAVFDTKSIPRIVQLQGEAGLVERGKLPVRGEEAI